MDKEKGWTLYNRIPGLFNQKNISVSEMAAALGRRLSMPKEDSFKVVMEMKDQGLIDYQKNKGRIVFLK